MQVGRVGNESDMGGLALFLGSRASAFMTGELSIASTSKGCIGLTMGEASKVASEVGERGGGGVAG